MKKLFLLTCMLLCAAIGTQAQEDGGEPNQITVTPEISYCDADGNPIENLQPIKDNSGVWHAIAGSTVTFTVDNLPEGVTGGTYKKDKSADDVNFTVDNGKIIFDKVTSIPLDEDVTFTFTFGEESDPVEIKIQIQVYQLPEVSFKENEETEELNQDVTREFKVTVSNGWSISWQVSDKDISRTDQEFTLSYDQINDENEHTLELTLSYSGENSEAGNPWWTITYKYHFKFKASSTPEIAQIEFISNKDHVKNNVYVGEEVTVTALLKDASGKEISSEGHKFEWTNGGYENGTPKDNSYTFEAKKLGDDLNCEKRNYSVTVDDNENTKGIFEYYVWPKPDVKPSFEENEENNPEILNGSDNQTLSVEVKGGYKEDNKEDNNTVVVWAYAWYVDKQNEEDSPISVSNSFQLDISEYDKNKIYHVELVVKNIVPTIVEGKDSCWVDRTFNYYFKIGDNPTPATPQYTATISPDGHSEFVLHGENVQMKLVSIEDSDGKTLKDNNEKEVTLENLDGWVPSWTVAGKGSINTDGVFTADYPKDGNNDNNPSTATVRLTLKKGEESITGEYTFNVYKEIVVNQGETEYDNVDPKEVQTLGLTVTGGYPGGWSYSWTDNGTEVTNNNTPTYTVACNDVEKHEIKVIVKNMSPDNSAIEWYPKTDNPSETGTFTYIVNFQKPTDSDAKYKIELSTDYSQKSEGLHILTDSTAVINVKVLKKSDQDDQGEYVDVKGEEYENLKLTPSGCEWDDIKKCYIFTAKYNGTNNEEFIEQSVQFSLEEDNIKSKVLTFKVYATPKAVPENDGKYEQTIDEQGKASVTLTVNVSGGSEAGWLYYWDKANTPSKQNTYAVEFDKENKKKEIHLKVTNQSPDQKEPPYVWYTKELTYTVTFTDVTPKVTITLTKTPDLSNLLPGKEVVLTANVADANANLQEVKWFCNDVETQQSGETYTYTAENTNEKIPSNVSITAKLDDVVSNSVEFTIWPAPTLKDETWSEKVKLTDQERENAPVTKGIRSGNTILLPEVTPEMQLPTTEKIGDWEGYQWSYKWDFDGNDVSDEFSATVSNGQQDKTLSCVAVYAKEDKVDILWSAPIYTKTITIYPKPNTPASLVLKGNGTSHTWFVDDSSGLLMKKGTEDISITKSGTGWIISSECDANHKDQYFIYRTKGYDDDVIITSDARYENGEKTWDGSKYGTGTAVQQNAPSLVVGTYTINGTKTEGYVRGLNIIRLEDGTVKKVFNK